MKKDELPKLSIFETFKTKTQELTGEANRQRAIIVILATQTNPAERTRTGISQRIADENGTIWKNIYSGIFRDLDEVLLPLELVEEEGRLPLKRGPKALQEKGIPYYRLTQKGVIVALSLHEIIGREDILEHYLSSGEEKNEFYQTLLNISHVAPRFVFSLFEKYVRAYCEGNLDLLPLNQANLRRVSDESIIIQTEFLEGFSHTSVSERQKTLKFLEGLLEKSPNSKKPVM
jgi:hypothetical protein